MYPNENVLHISPTLLCCMYSAIQRNACQTQGIFKPYLSTMPMCPFAFCDKAGEQRLYG